MFKLLSTANPKIQKGTQLGYLSFILHLAPADLSGKNTCPKATAGCRAACLNTAGRGGLFKQGETTNVIQRARIRKTQQYFEQRDQFLADLEADIRRAIKQAEKQGLKPAIRLNGTSDLAVEKWGIIEKFPDVQFYDYTKVLGRRVAHLKNYHLTFSRAESNASDVAQALKQGMNVTVVYDEIPKGVYSADQHDLRFLDPAVGFIGLKAKGRARKDTSGFVVHTRETA
jgi:hypothetical protein